MAQRVLILWQDSFQFAAALFSAFQTCTQLFSRELMDVGMCPEAVNTGLNT